MQKEDPAARFYKTPKGARGQSGPAGWAGGERRMGTDLFVLVSYFLAVAAFLIQIWLIFRMG